MKKKERTEKILTEEELKKIIGGGFGPSVYPELVPDYAGTGGGFGRTNAGQGLFESIANYLRGKH